MPTHSSLEPSELHEAKRHKANVRAASVATVTLASAVENGDSLDGVTLATGDRILLKNQSAGAENGVYEVAASGAPARAEDCADDDNLFKGFIVYVEEGTQAGSVWAHTTTAAITLETTALTFAQVGSSGTPASSVVAETSYGGSSAVGSSTNYARQDHTHGSPSLGSSGSTAAAGNHTHAAADIASGTIATARLGSGTADATTFLRGDQTYATPAGGGGTTLSETVYNGSGGTLVKGTVVREVGAQSGNVKVNKLLSDTHTSDTVQAFGVLSGDIANTATGTAVRAGQLAGLDTSGFSVGDYLYCSATGTLATSAGSGNTHFGIGYVLTSHATTGTIEVALKSFSAPIHKHSSNDNDDGGPLEAPYFFEIAAPSSPGASFQKVYIDSTTHHLTRKDSAASVVDLETLGGTPAVATDAIWDAKGDLAVGTGSNTAAKLTAGANGLILTADSGETTGLKWSAAGSGSVAADAIWDAKGDLAAGTGSDTASKLTVGANDTILMADSAQATGLKWIASQTPSTQAFSDSAAEGTADTYARGDHKHAMPANPGALTTATAALSADVTMASGNTYYDGPSVSLAAGTWFVTATITLTSTSQLIFTAKLWDGTTVADSAEQVMTGNSLPVCITLVGLVSPGSTTTYKVSAADNGATGTMLAAAVHNGAGNNASTIVAVKVA